LDVQTVIGLAAGIPTSFLSVGNILNVATVATDISGAFFDTTTFLSTTQNPPSVFTTSFGFDEAQFSPQDLQYVAVTFRALGFPFFFTHPRLRRKICNGYMAAGARGISVIFASGDNGVHARADPTGCSNNTFVVEFPASCPYGRYTSVQSPQLKPLT
jgi:tripeptidyl-peptidase-1